MLFAAVDLPYSAMASSACLWHKNFFGSGDKLSNSALDFAWGRDCRCRAFCYPSCAQYVGRYAACGIARHDPTSQLEIRLSVTGRVSSPRANCGRVETFGRVARPPKELIQFQVRAWRVPAPMLGMSECALCNCAGAGPTMDPCPNDSDVGVHSNFSCI
jgi:hypothetical protein